MIELTINGEKRRLGESSDLARLVDELALPDRRVAVELNGSVVRRTDWAGTELADGDRLEIVHFVGGG